MLDMRRLYGRVSRRQTVHLESHSFGRDDASSVARLGSLTLVRQLPALFHHSRHGTRGGRIFEDALGRVIASAHQRDRLRQLGARRAG